MQSWESEIRGAEGGKFPPPPPPPAATSLILISRLIGKLYLLDLKRRHFHTQPWPPTFLTTVNPRSPLSWYTGAAPPGRQPSKVAKIALVEEENLSGGKQEALTVANGGASAGVHSRMKRLAHPALITLHRLLGVSQCVLRVQDSRFFCFGPFLSPPLQC